MPRAAVRSHETSARARVSAVATAACPPEARQDVRRCDTRAPACVIAEPIDTILQFSTRKSVAPRCSTDRLSTPSRGKNAASGPEITASGTQGGDLTGTPALALRLQSQDESEAFVAQWIRWCPVDSDVGPWRQRHPLRGFFGGLGLKIPPAIHSQFSQRSGPTGIRPGSYTAAGIMEGAAARSVSKMFTPRSAMDFADSVSRFAAIHIILSVDTKTSSTPFPKHQPRPKWPPASDRECRRGSCARASCRYSRPPFESSPSAWRAAKGPCRTARGRLR